MPPKRSRLKCIPLCTVIAVLLMASATAKAQTGNVTLQGTVSETLTLSVSPTLIDANIVTSRLSNTVRVTLSDHDPQAPVRLPLLVRSNSAFRISAAVESEAAWLSQLSIVAVRATGKLVSPQSISELNVPPQLDLRGLSESALTSIKPPDLSRSVLVVSGPRVSLGGTLDSSNNALEITFLIRLKPGHRSPVQLTFAATADH